jgi:hypothetical protein
MNIFVEKRFLYWWGWSSTKDHKKRGGKEAQRDAKEN